MKEKHPISRREALRCMLTTAGIMSISPSLMGFYDQLTGMFDCQRGNSYQQSLSPDRFFINRIREALKGDGQMPVLPMSSNQRHYDIYTLLFADKAVRKGSVRLNLNKNTLTVEVERTGWLPENYCQYTFVTQEIRPDGLLSPISWQYKSYLAKTMLDMPYRTPLEGTGEYDDKGRITIIEGLSSHKYQASLPATINRNLLLAIDGLAKGDLPFSFDIIDEYDLYAGARKIQAYGTAEIESDGKTTALHAVVMTGQGTLPTFFWLDENDIPLFVNTATEVLIISR